MSKSNPLLPPAEPGWSWLGALLIGGLLVGLVMIFTL
jgi:hypothetical protein